MTTLLKPARGGNKREVLCARFVRDFLLGLGPYGSEIIDADVGSFIANIFFNYIHSQRRVMAIDLATRHEEKLAHKQGRNIDPDNIEKLTRKYLERLPCKGFSCRYHSFVVYFSNLIRLGWVEFTGRDEPSAFQDHYFPGQPRKYFRLTQKGKEASDDAWRNPLRALYGPTRGD